MSSQPQSVPPPSGPETEESAAGIAHWSAEAVRLWKEARRELGEETVHRLRVAVRRCRSMAEGLSQLDPDPGWPRLRRQGRKLFRGLGALRDVQVMKIWLARLAPEEDPVRRALEAILDRREASERIRAAKAVKSFDAKKWRKITERLDRRAARIAPGDPAFQHQALQRWEEGYELHRLAVRDRSKTAYHRLRIGLKRFRYTVENFLPEHHLEWRKELKHLQGQLGDVHDLDVLWDLLPESGEVFDNEARRVWKRRVEEERRKKLADYRRMMVGSSSRWALWRSELPRGEALEEAAVATLEARAGFLGRDSRRSKAVEALAGRLYDLLAGALKGTPFEDRRWKFILRGAACLDDSARTGSGKKAKKVADTIRELDPPLGWSREDLETAAEITRCRHTLDAAKLNKRLARAPLPRRKAVLILAGILRLAGFLDRHDLEPAGLLSAEPREKAVALRLRTAAAPDRLLLDVGAWKNLLEWACRRSVLVEVEG